MNLSKIIRHRVPRAFRDLANEHRHALPNRRVRLRAPHPAAIAELSQLEQDMRKSIHDWKQCLLPTARAQAQRDRRGMLHRLFDDVYVIHREVAVKLLTHGKDEVDRLASKPGLSREEEHALVAAISLAYAEVADRLFALLEEAHLELIRSVEPFDDGPEERPPMNDDPWAAFRTNHNQPEP